MKKLVNFFRPNISFVDEYSYLSTNYKDLREIDIKESIKKLGSIAKTKRDLKLLRSIKQTIDTHQKITKLERYLNE